MFRKKEISLLIIILLIAGFLRFFNLMHDSPYFFNPDERNMANAISQFRLPAKLSEIPPCIFSQFSIIHYPLSASQCNLNPHFFSYGQFPLYLAFVSDQIISQIIRAPLASQGGPLQTSFPSAIFWLRFYSALTSVLTVLMVYLITKELFKKINQLSIIHYPLSIIAALMAAFSPGLIQSAHFGTTESILTFFFLASVYLSIRYLSNLGNLEFVLLTSLTIGLSLGSKLTGIFFFIPPFISLVIRTIKLLNLRKKKLFIGLFENLRIGLFLIIGSILVFILSSPYNLVEPESFRSAVFGYESDVATGKYEAFYTRQFVNTTPIIFQAEKVFPYALGWPVFVLGTLGFLLITLKQIIGIILIILRLNKKSKIKYQKYILKIKNFEIFNFSSVSFIFYFSFLIYFFPNSFLFAKWTRFTTPILPFFSIFAAFALFEIYSVFNVFRSQFSIFQPKADPPRADNLQFSNKSKILKSKYLSVICYLLSVILLILPGIAFMSIYTHEDTRVTASKWIYQNIPDNSYILSETANVVDIPLGISKASKPHQVCAAHTWCEENRNYQIISFDFYHTDENPTILFTQLLSHLEKADYIFIPSRRIFANYTKLPRKYPLVTKYYQLLFSGALGFEKVTEISSFPQLPISQIGPISLIGNDENAEETFTVFDHPVIRIYRKVKPFTIDEYRSLFNTAKID